MQEFPVDNGTATKRVAVSNDPKRPGLLIGRCYNAEGKLITTLWGQLDQEKIKDYIVQQPTAPFGAQG